MGLANGLVMVSDLETKHLETAHDLEGVSVDVVAFAPDGEHLAVAAHDNKVCIPRILPDQPQYY